MIPVHLQIKGFLSYRESVDIDFSGFSLACISGTNGAGKSSLLDAITWVLFGKARRDDDAVINTTSDSARVVLEFLYEGATYRVAREKFRNKTGTLEFNVRSADGRWNVQTMESMRMTEARICETLKLDYETFINASFFLQGKADQFAQQKPSDRKRILGSILGLERWQAYQEEAAARRKIVQAEIDLNDGRMGEINTELGEEEERKQKLAALESECEQVSRERVSLETTVQTNERLEMMLKAQEESITRMDSDLQNVLTRRDQIVAKFEERQNEIAKSELLLKNEPLVESRYREWDMIRSEKERLDSLATRFHQLESRQLPPRQQIAEERGRLQQESANLDRLQADISSMKRELETLEQNLPKLKTRFESISALAETRPIIDAELRLVSETKTRLETENSQLGKTGQDQSKRLVQLQAVEGADCPLCGQPLTHDHRKELLFDLDREINEQRDLYRANQQTIKQKQQEKDELEKRLREIDQAVRQAQEAQGELNKTTGRIDMMKQKVKELEVDISKAETARKTLESGQFASEARSEYEAISSEMVSLGFDPEQLEEITRKESELRSVEGEKQSIISAKASLEQLKREAASLREQHIENLSEINRREKDLEKARAQLAEQSEGLPDLVELKRNLDSLKDKENNLRSDLGSARSKVQVLETQRKRLQELTEKRQELTRQVDRFRTLERAFGKDGVQALLIEEALPEIETQANEILDGLSGGSMSVQFATQKEYKDRNRDDKKETLEILISDGAGIRAYEMFSGGEAFRVNFAIRLALSRVLANRAGARLQTLVIDEGFGSQDVDGRQRLIETINQVKPDFARILVITHLEELKDAFPARIEVEKSAQHGSKVSVFNDYA